MQLHKIFLFPVFIISLLFPVLSYSQLKPNPEIKINQVGYYPYAQKTFFVSNQKKINSFSIVDLESMRHVYKGTLEDQEKWNLSGETIQQGNFSEFSQQGIFSIYIKDAGYSFPFEIGEAIYFDALTASIKSFYYQRASIELKAAYAGTWQRPKGHPDLSISFHPDLNKQGSKDVVGGWYDAGDYGKYVVNGAFAAGQMLMLHEQFPSMIQDSSLLIPESGNSRSDLLDEIKYEVDWLLAMQDEDGGVFFKLTTLDFGDMVLPHLAVKPRYIIGKNTSASLNFAACTAKAFRAYKDNDQAFAKQCLHKAERAWKWAILNPDETYKNPSNVSTGEYGDQNFSEEFYWAAAELYISTEKEEYHQYLKDHPLPLEFKAGNSWATYMKFLAAFAIVQYGKDPEMKEHIQYQLIAQADLLTKKAQNNDYKLPIDDFHWGSNSDVLNAAIILSQAYRISPKAEYLNSILHCIDYIFGKNAVNTCFLTAYGKLNPRKIHHRPSAGDTFLDPVPGLLSGGPNSRRQDENFATYPENVRPMKSWVDQQESFASNEICLNWNAPLVYLLGFLENEFSGDNY